MAGGSVRLKPSSFPVKDSFTAIVYPGEKTCGVARVKAILKAITATNRVDQVGKCASAEAYYEAYQSYFAFILFQIFLLRPSAEPVSWSEAAPGVPVRVLVLPPANVTSLSARTLGAFSLLPDASIRTEAVFTISSADCGSVGGAATKQQTITAEEVCSYT